jgi:hypothetical protein
MAKLRIKCPECSFVDVPTSDASVFQTEKGLYYVELLVGAHHENEAPFGWCNAVKPGETRRALRQIPDHLARILVASSVQKLKNRNICPMLASYKILELVVLQQKK